MTVVAWLVALAGIAAVLGGVFGAGYALGYQRARWSGYLPSRRGETLDLTAAAARGELPFTPFAGLSELGPDPDLVDVVDAIQRERGL